MLPSLLWSACSTPSRTDPPSPRVELRLRPPPTENLVEEGEEEEHREERREWIERRHATPSGVDWHAVERDNARASLDRARTRIRGAEQVPGTWVERGSENQAGSMFTVRRTPDGRLYAGSALGGLWRGSVDGDGWTPIGDALFGGAHRVAWLPATGGEPEVLLAAPSDGGLLTRSTDDGATWSVPGGAEEVSGALRLEALADGTVLACVREGQRTVLLRSDDRGATFAPDQPSCGGLWVARDGSRRVLLASGESLSVSSDGGATWSARTLPASSSSGWLLAASEATDPLTVYASRAGGYGAREVWRSDDGGQGWTSVGEVDDLWEAFTASIRDPLLVVAGGVDAHVSRDGGASWASPNTWDEYYADPEHKLHADMMAITVEPDVDGETWYVGNHGGVYVSTDGLRSVRNLSLSGLRVSQYYSTLTDWKRPDRVVLGAQDQGLQHATGDEVSGRWNVEQVWSGDYGQLVSKDHTHRWVFGVYPGFVMTWNEEGGQDPILGVIDYPPGDGAPWLPVLTADPKRRDAFWFLGRDLWRYQRSDLGFEATRMTTGPTGSWWLTAMAFHPFDPDRAWFVTSDGRVFRSEAGGVDWKQVAKNLPAANDYYGNALVVSRLDPDVLYLGGSGYAGGAVRRSTDGGDTFQDWSEGLPPTLVYTLVEAYDGSGRVLAGTETGAWLREKDGAAWIDVSSGRAPTTNYWSAEPIPDADGVRFSTYGRGVWDLLLEPAGEGCWPTLDGDGDGVPCDLDCDDTDPDIVPDEVLRCSDVDRDGATVEVDCDDRDPARAPDAPETLCDDLDQDCDGADLCPAVTGGCSTGGAGPWPGTAAVLAAAATAQRARARRRPSRATAPSSAGQPAAPGPLAQPQPPPSSSPPVEASVGTVSPSSVVAGGSSVSVSAECEGSVTPL